MNQISEQYTMRYINGFVALILIAVIFIMGLGWALSSGNFSLGVIFVPVVLLATRFRIVQPNTALVSTLFGHYAGTIVRQGFYWIIPFYTVQKVSLRTANYVTPTLKVNDISGTPIEVAGAIVYRIDNPAAAVFDVEDVHDFMRVQSESAVRSLVSHYPYASADGGDSLGGLSPAILTAFRNMVQERVEQAGVHIEEARFTHLAYAPEIAQAMLRKQQAESVLVARQTLVKGAILMVEGTVKELERRQIVRMSDGEKAKLITNMMTVLLSEESASPVVNVSGD